MCCYLLFVFVGSFVVLREVGLCCLEIIVIPFNCLIQLIENDNVPLISSWCLLFDFNNFSESTWLYSLSGINNN